MTNTQFREEAADPKPQQPQQPQQRLVSANAVRQAKINEGIVAEQKRHGIKPAPKTHDAARDAMLRDIMQRGQG